MSFFNKNIEILCFFMKIFNLPSFAFAEQATIEYSLLLISCSDKNFVTFLNK